MFISCQLSHGICPKWFTPDVEKTGKHTFEPNDS